MTINSRPTYGDPIGRVDARGRVVLLDSFEKFLDDLVAQGTTNSAAVTTMEGITSSLTALLLKKPVVVVTNADYECAGQEDVVVCTAALTLKLPASPRRNQNVKVVKVTVGDITIDGNGKTTMADTDILFNAGTGSALNLTYILDQDDWRIT